MLNKIMQEIVILARLTVLNEAALCGLIMLKKRSNVILKINKVLHENAANSTKFPAVQNQ